MRHVANHDADARAPTGRKCRVDRLLTRFPDRLRQQKMVLRVRGKERIVRVSDAEVLLRGVLCGQAMPARVIVITGPGLKLKPWYLVTTDLELEPLEAVRAYDGRYQIETNFDEVKELGLGHYQGRSGQASDAGRSFWVWRRCS